MRWLHTLRVRTRSIFRREGVERQLDAELRFHIDQQAEENLRAGMSSEAARLAALRATGSVALVKDQCRESLGLRFLDELRQDIRYALRSFKRNRGFAAVVILTLALGVGANAAVFSVVNAVLLRPLPYHEPNRIVTLSTVTDRPLGTPFRQVSVPDFRDWQRQAAAFQAMAYYADQQVAVTVGSGAAYAHVARVSSDFFRVFDVQGSRCSSRQRRDARPWWHAVRSERD